MAAEAVRWNSLQRKEWNLFGKEFFNDCLQNSNLQSCQETVQKWKNKSYGNLSISDRNEWEGFVVDQYQPLINLCGKDAVCQFHISQNMIISMIKYADKPKYAHDWINDEIQALRIAIPTYKGDKSQIALLAAHDFGWMVEAGALGSFGGKALQFLRPILSGNKVVVRSLSHAPHSIDASRLRHVMPSSWFKSGYIQKTSIAMAEIETTAGKVERVMAVSEKAWHGTNAPKSIEWQGK